MIPPLTPTDDRLGTYAADGSVKTWPARSIDGREGLTLQQATLHNLSSPHFYITAPGDGRIYDVTLAPHAPAPTAQKRIDS